MADYSDDEEHVMDLEAQLRELHAREKRVEDSLRKYEERQRAKKMHQHNMPERARLTAWYSGSKQKKCRRSKVGKHYVMRDKNSGEFCKKKKSRSRSRK